MKLVLKIFNAVYLVLAAVAITCFFTRPYVDLKGSYTLKGNQVADIIMKANVKDITQEEVLEIVGEESIKIDFGAKVETKYVINFNDKEGLKNSILQPLETTKNNVLDKVFPLVNNVVKKMATKTAINIIREQIENKIKELSPTTEPKQAMENAKITDAYIKEFAERVYDRATTTDPDLLPVTVHDIMVDVVKDYTLDVVKRLGEQAGIPAFLIDQEKISQDMTDSIEVTMTAKFIENEFAQADGTIIDLKAKVKSKVEEQVNKTLDEYATSFSDYSLYYFIALLALVAPWLALAIFSIIRIIRRKKIWVKSWYVFAFASIQLILGVVLTIATSKFLPQIANVLPLEDFKDVLSSLTLDVKTSSFLPSILYLAMIPLTIVYMILAHRVKKNYKLEKKEAKKA